MHAAGAALASKSKGEAGVWHSSACWLGTGAVCVGKFSRSPCELGTGPERACQEPQVGCGCCHSGSSHVRGQLNEKNAEII